MNTVQRYDPSNGTWSIVAPLHQARWGAAAAVACGKIFVFGGWTQNGSQYGLACPVEEYDPSSPTPDWTVCASMECGYARSNLAAVTIGSGNYARIYLIGGNRSCTFLDAVQEFDPIYKTWKDMTPMPTARCSHTAVAIGGCIYVLGGYQYVNGSVVAASSIEIGTLV